MARYVLYGLILGASATSHAALIANGGSDDCQNSRCLMSHVSRGNPPLCASSEMCTHADVHTSTASFSSGSNGFGPAMPAKVERSHLEWGAGASHPRYRRTFRLTAQAATLRPPGGHQADTF